MGLVAVVLGVVHRLARGDLSQPLAGAPQFPCDLGRVEEEEEEVGQRNGGESGERKA